MEYYDDLPSLSSSDDDDDHQRKTIHPERFAHIMKLITNDENSNPVTICSVEEYYRRSGTFDSCDNNDDNYVVSFPEDESDLCSESVRLSIHSVRSEVYSLIDSKIADTLSELNKSLMELNEEDNRRREESFGSARFKFCFEMYDGKEDQCRTFTLSTSRAASLQRDLKWSGYRKLPEGVELTLGELRAMALRQQQQIDCQHQLLAAREQRLRFLKQQEARHHQVAAENEKLRRLRERVEAQELKLRRLRALRGQLDQTNINNAALTSDLESIRALFNEKEKELSVAVAKVEELTRQLEEVRRGRAPPRAQPPAALELDKLRKELMYRNKLNEQQNARLSQQREALTARQAEMASIDQRISELQTRLHRKRVANTQLAAQISAKHHAPRFSNPSAVQVSGYPPSGGVVSGGKNQMPRGNIAAVEPYNHVPHAPSLSHNFQALKHNALQNTIPAKLLGQQDQHITKQDSHYLQQKQFTNHIFNNGIYPQRMQANHIQTDTHFNQQFPAGKQNDIGYQSQQSDPKILLDHINKYNIDLQKTTGGINQNLNNPPTSQSNQINNRHSVRPSNEQEFLPEFAASKSDPKYQTLPYNTKFTANSVKTKNSQEESVTKVSSSSTAVTGVSSSSMNPMTAHSQPLTVNKGLVTPISQTQTGLTEQQTNTLNSEQHNTYHLSKTDSNPKSNQEEKENIIHPNMRINHNGPNVDQFKLNQYKLQPPLGGRADLVRSFPQQAAATPTVKPVSSVAPTSVQVASGKPSPIYQTSSTKIQPVQPQTVSQSLLNNNQNHATKPLQTLSNIPHSQAQNSSGQSLLLSPPQSSSTPLSTPDVSNDKIIPKPALPPKPVSKIPVSTADLHSIAATQSQNQASDSAESSATSDVPQNDPEVSPIHSSVPPTSTITSTTTTQSENQPMIIKARPLTIRKQPLSEQPKLKSQLSTAKNNAVNLATTRRIEMPSAYLFAEMDKLTSEQNHQDLNNQNSKFNGNKISTPTINTNSNTDVPDRAIISPDISETSSEDQSEKNGVTNLADQMNAVDLNNGEIVSRRIKKGNLKQSGKINLSRRVSFDPLALLLDASLEGELELVRKTATQVANASAANDEGITALHNAICAGHFEIVKFLVEFGCDVNAQDSDGWTPLHCAASCNNVAMVRFLVENGACIFATTLSDQETAAQKCEEDEEGFDGCSEYLYSVQEKLGIMNGGVVYAVFNYSAHEPDELSFSVGTKMSVVRKGDDAEREWWWARTHNGQEGYVPRNLLGLYPRVTPKSEQ